MAARSRPSGSPVWIERLAASLPGQPVRILETHISWVLLSGDFAYKIKKPLTLGFLDFGTLGKRHQACEDEVRLNRRLAPDIYLGVSTVTGPADSPCLEGAGETIEYAVKMRRFDPEATFDRLQAEGRLEAVQVEAVATRLARFHRDDCARAQAGDAWGHPGTIWQPVAQNLDQIEPHLDTPADRATLAALRVWSGRSHAELTPLMRARKRDGYVRECHGDLHLGNMAWVDGAPLIFDCLEFDAGLRWIDIQSEIAFVFMDLMRRGHAGLAWLFLNVWLEHSGDYAGLALLRYYAVYRALVRSKVALLRAAQNDASARADARAHLELAAALTRPSPCWLHITHGFSGSGKTTATHERMQSPGAIRLRSDIERKRLAGLDALARSGSAPCGGLYAAHATRRTYGQLAGLASRVLAAGWPVIVDATFTARWQRALLREIARKHGQPFRILDFAAPLDTLRQRIVQRARAGTDASEASLAVLAHQIRNADALDAEELKEALSPQDFAQN